MRLSKSIALLFCLSCYAQNNNMVDLLRQTRSAGCTTGSLLSISATNGAASCSGTSWLGLGGYSIKTSAGQMASGIFLGPQASGNSQNSQLFTFSGTNSGGVAKNAYFWADANGTATIQSPTGLVLNDLVNNMILSNSSYGLYVYDGNKTGISIGAIGTGNGVNSQALLFRSRTSGGTNNSSYLESTVDGGFNWVMNGNDKFKFYKTPGGVSTQLMELDSAGKLGINKASPDWRLHISDTDPTSFTFGGAKYYHSGLQYEMGAVDWTPGYNFSPKLIEGIRSQMMVPYTANPPRGTGSLTMMRDPNFYSGVSAHVVSQTERMTATGILGRAWMQQSQLSVYGQGTFTGALAASGAITISASLTDVPPAALYQWETGNTSYQFYVLVDNEWMIVTSVTGYASSTYPISLTLNVPSTGRAAWGSTLSGHSAGNLYISVGGYAFGGNTLAIGGTIFCETSILNSYGCSVARQNTEIAGPSRLTALELNLAPYGPITKVEGILINSVGTMAPVETSPGINIARLGAWGASTVTVSGGNTVSVTSYPLRWNIGDKIYLNNCTAGANDSTQSSAGVENVTVSATSGQLVATLSKALIAGGTCIARKIVNDSWVIPWSTGFFTSDGGATIGADLGLLYAYAEPNTTRPVRSQPVRFKSYDAVGAFKYSTIDANPYGVPTITPADQGLATLAFAVVKNNTNTTGLAGVGFNVSQDTSGELDGNIMKGFIGMIRTGTYGVGDIVLAIEPTANTANATVANAMLRLKSNASIVMPQLKECASVSAASKEICYDSGASNVLKYKP